MYRLSKTGIFCIAFSFLLRPVNAQDMFSSFEQRKEKAISELKKYTRPDTARVNALIRVFRTAIFSKQQQQVKPYFDEAMVASKRLRYTKGIAECYLFNAHFNRATGNVPVAQAYYDSIIEVS